MLLYESRDQIDAKYKWKLEDIIADNQAWEELFFKTDERIGHFSKYADRLCDDDALFDCLELETRLTHDIMCLYQYAKMRLDQDTRDNAYQGMTNRVRCSSSSFRPQPVLSLPKSASSAVKNLKRSKTANASKTTTCFLAR